MRIKILQNVMKVINLSSRKQSFFYVFILIFFLMPSVSYSQSLLCRAWINVSSGLEIGQSFTSKIDGGVITFFGEQRPVSSAQLIYSHPLHDIFMAASGEIVTASLEGQRVRINVYFPSKEIKFFVTSSCSKI